MIQASEFFRYFIDRADLENPEKTFLPSNGSWGPGHAVAAVDADGTRRPVTSFMTGSSARPNPSTMFPRPFWSESAPATPSISPHLQSGTARAIRALNTTPWNKSRRLKSKLAPQERERHHDPTHPGRSRTAGQSRRGQGSREEPQSHVRLGDRSQRPLEVRPARRRGGPCGGGHRPGQGAARRSRSDAPPNRSQTPWPAIPWPVRRSWRPCRAAWCCSAGGVPILDAAGETIGAIGAAGDAPDNDEAIVLAAVAG